jgi:hypothetical protein
MQDTKPLENTAKLEEGARAALVEHQKRVSTDALEIEGILLRENLTWGEWQEVVDLFDTRTLHLIRKTKVKTLKENYERST